MSPSPYTPSRHGPIRYRLAINLKTYSFMLPSIDHYLIAPPIVTPGSPISVAAARLDWTSLQVLFSIFIRCSFYEYPLEVSPVYLLNRDYRVIKNLSHGLLSHYLRHYRKYHTLHLPHRFAPLINPWKKTVRNRKGSTLWPFAVLCSFRGGLLLDHFGVGPHGHSIN